MNGGLRRVQLGQGDEAARGGARGGCGCWQYATQTSIEQDGVSAHPHHLFACNLVLTVSGKVLDYNKFLM